jgi:hypothetical protein
MDGQFMPLRITDRLAQPLASLKIVLAIALITSEGHIPPTSSRVLLLADDTITISASLHGLVIAACPIFNHAAASREINRLFHVDSFYRLQLTPLQLRTS